MTDERCGPCENVANDATDACSPCAWLIQRAAFALRSRDDLPAMLTVATTGSLWLATYSGRPHTGPGCQLQPAIDVLRHLHAVMRRAVHRRELMFRVLRARFQRVDRGLAGDGGHADNASALLVGAKHARDAAERHTGKRRRAVVDCAAERRSSDDVGDHSAERRRTRALRVDDVLGQRRRLACVSRRPAGRRRRGRCCGSASWRAADRRHFVGFAQRLAAERRRSGTRRRKTLKRGRQRPNSVGGPVDTTKVSQTSGALADLNTAPFCIRVMLQSSGATANWNPEPHASLVHSSMRSAEKASPRSEGAAATRFCV